MSATATDQTTSTYQVGKKLVDLCNMGKSKECLETLYDQNIVSIEAMTGGQIPQRVEGIDAVRQKTEWWENNHKVHSGHADGPWPHGDKFIVHFKFDVTATSGPMANKRMTLDEAGLYTVRNGKITQEEFFYHMG